MYKCMGKMYSSTKGFTSLVMEEASSVQITRKKMTFIMCAEVVVQEVQLCIVTCLYLADLGLNSQF